MTYVQPSWSSKVHLSTYLVIAVSVATLGCGSSGEGTGGTDVVILDAGPGGGTSCIQPFFPAEEPDLLNAPLFSQRQLQPGADIEAEISVDGQTRNVTADLVNAWSLTSPPLKTLELKTSGSATLPLVFSFPDEAPFSGRYAMKITLCGANCDETRVVFTLLFEDPNLLPEYYQRIVYEGDEEVRSEDTCLRLNTVVLQ